LSPILDWTVAIVRFAMRERRGVAPLIRVVETIFGLYPEDDGVVERVRGTRIK